MPKWLRRNLTTLPHSRQRNVKLVMYPGLNWEAIWIQFRNGYHLSITHLSILHAPTRERSGRIAGSIERWHHNFIGERDHRKVFNQKEENPPNGHWQLESIRRCLTWLKPNNSVKWVPWCRRVACNVYVMVFVTQCISFLGRSYLCVRTKLGSVHRFVLRRQKMSLRTVVPTATDRRRSRPRRLSLITLKLSQSQRMWKVTASEIWPNGYSYCSVEIEGRLLNPLYNPVQRWVFPPCNVWR